MAPALKWQDISEIVAGFIASGKLSPGSVRPESLIEPYPTLIQTIRRKKRLPTSDELITLIGLANYDAITAASERYRRLPADWPAVLERAASNHYLGTVMERASKRLLAGEDADLSPVDAAIKKTQMHYGRVIRMSDIKVNAQESDFVKTGYEPLDKYIGGVPKSSMTLVVGPPGTGKTFFYLAVAAALATIGKRSMLFSLEMTHMQLARRAMLRMGLTKKQAELIYICDDIINANELVNITSRSDGMDFVGVDFAELMVRGEKSESTMSEGYETLAIGAKEQGIPYLVLSQMNRASMVNIPTMGAARHTGHADAVTALELGLFNPTTVMLTIGNGAQIELIPGNGAIVVIKSRYGTQMEEAKGAIEIPFSGTKGWGTKAVRWHSGSNWS